MKTRTSIQSRIAGMIFAALGLLPFTAEAASITVANFSFEDPVLADGASGAPTGWVVTDAGAAAVNPTDADYAGATGGALPSPALGNQCGAVQSGNYSYFKQTTGATIEEGVTYTLTVAVGDRSDATPYDNILLRLGYGSAKYLSIIETQQFAPSDLEDGAFRDLSISFTAQVGAAYIGEQLAILIGASNNNTASKATDFDNVRLMDDTVIPEPSTVLLAGLGGLGLLSRRFRRKTGVSVQILTKPDCRK